MRHIGSCRGGWGHARCVLIALLLATAGCGGGGDDAASPDSPGTPHVAVPDASTPVIAAGADDASGATWLTPNQPSSQLANPASRTLNGDVLLAGGYAGENLERKAQCDKPLLRAVFQKHSESSTPDTRFALYHWLCDEREGSDRFLSTSLEASSGASPQELLATIDRDTDIESLTPLPEVVAGWRASNCTRATNDPTYHSYALSRLVPEEGFTDWFNCHARRVIDEKAENYYIHSNLFCAARENSDRKIGFRVGGYSSRAFVADPDATPAPELPGNNVTIAADNATVPEDPEDRTIQSDETKTLLFNWDDPTKAASVSLIAKLENSWGDYYYYCNKSTTHGSMPLTVFPSRACAFENDRCIPADLGHGSPFFILQNCDDRTGKWVDTQSCPWGCALGVPACAYECTPGDQDCNADGTAPRHCDDTGRWRDDEPCPPTEVSDFGACEFDPTRVCSTKGLQVRVVAEHFCRDARCQTETREEQQVCTRATDGQRCGTTDYGAWSTCSYGSACAEAGTASRTVQSQECRAGTCTTTSSTQNKDCDRETDGQSCGATDYGAWSTCSYASVCAEEGSMSRTVQSRNCRAGTCTTTSSRQNTGCARETDDQSCGATDYGPWSTCSYDSVCAEEGIASRTVQSRKCQAGTCTTTSSRQEEGCAHRDTDGIECDSWTTPHPRCRWQEFYYWNVCEQGYCPNTPVYHYRPPCDHPGWPPAHEP